MLQVYVLKIAKGAKVALTQKTEEERQAEATMAQSGMGAGPKRGTKTMSAALSSLGFKATPKPKVLRLSLIQHCLEWNRPVLHVVHVLPCRSVSAVSAVSNDDT